jgi:hypothetical protein
VGRIAIRSFPSLPPVLPPIVLPSALSTYSLRPAQIKSVPKPRCALSSRGGLLERCREIAIVTDVRDENRGALSRVCMREGGLYITCVVSCVVVVECGDEGYC